MRLEPATHRSRIKHSTTKPPSSSLIPCYGGNNYKCYKSYYYKSELCLTKIFCHIDDKFRPNQEEVRFQACSCNPLSILTQDYILRIRRHFQNKRIANKFMGTFSCQGLNQQKCAFFILHQWRIQRGLYPLPAPVFKMTYENQIIWSQ